MADVEDRILSSSRFARRCVTRRVHKHDNGWAWVVVICGSLCNAFVLGCSYSFGVIYPSLLDEFKRGKAQTGKFSPVKQLRVWDKTLCRHRAMKEVKRGESPRHTHDSIPVTRRSF